MKILSLKSKAGVTILEGVIALGLLAMLMAGAFGVLLSVSRKSSEPDMREEMMRAIETANDMLREYAPYAPGWIDSSLLTKIQAHQRDTTFRNKSVDYKQGLCGGDLDPLGSGTHKIDCLLPPICGDASACAPDGCFTYTVNTATGFGHVNNWPKWVNDAWEGKNNEQMYFEDTAGDGYVLQRDTTSFNNQNNGFSGVVPGYTVRFKIKCNGYELYE